MAALYFFELDELFGFASEAIDEGSEQENCDSDRRLYSMCDNYIVMSSLQSH